MWLFRRIDPERILLELARETHFLSFVGAGGKTTLIEYLAAQAIRQGKRAAITTTTKIWVKKPCVLWADLDWGRAARPDFVRVGKSVEKGKLTALQPEEVAKLGSAYDLVLIEADGSKGRPVKYPADYEPVVPVFSDHVVVVAGLDGLSGRLDEQVFRWELFEKATGVAGEARVTPSLLLRFFEDDAMMKGVNRQNCVIVLNKYDACLEKSEAMDVAKEVLEKAGVARVIVASTLFETFYLVERA